MTYRSRHLALLTPLLTLAVLTSGACGPESSVPSLDGGVDAVVDASTADALPDTSGETVRFQSPEIDGSGSCEGLAGYEAHAAGEAALEWSTLHARVRFFGTHQDPFEVDAQLVAALGGADAVVGEVVGTDRAFRAYASSGHETCLVAAWPSAPSPPSSALPGVQWVAPDGSALELSAATTHLLVDLRAAPEGETLSRFLERLALLTLREELRLEPQTRGFDGMRDEAWAPTFAGSENTYRSRVAERPIVYEGNVERAISVGFVVGDRIAPSAARFVVAMRNAGRAAIIGHGIDTSVAEHSANPAGSGGLLFRTMKLQDAEYAPLPDRFPADLAFDEASVTDVENAFVELDLAGIPAPSGPSERADIEPLPTRTLVVATERNEGTRQAALLATHGATKLFFPYWDVVDSDPDARLLETLTLGRLEDERQEFYNFRSIRYFSHALHDSHCMTWFHADTPDDAVAVGILPVLLDATSLGEPVVRISDHPDFQVGDVIVGVNDDDATLIMERYQAITSSSDSSAVRNSLRVFNALSGVRDYRLRAPDGTERTVSVDASTLVDTTLPTFPNRPRGALDDLGHPEYHYVDLSGSAMSGPIDEVLAAIDEAEAVVFDMRGYPGPNSWALARHILYEGSPGPQMRQIHQTVLDRRSLAVPQMSAPNPAGYRGDVVVLVSPSTQSQAEHLVLTLQAADRVRVVGRPSAGANGNITSIALPGNYAQSFTGMVILQPDESVFHGVGVRVDEPVDIEPGTLASGVDPELAAAIGLLER